jgi:uncharacterized membrane protein
MSIVSRSSIDHLASTTAEWNAAVTRLCRGRFLAWRSEPGSLIDHCGQVQLQQESLGTRVTVSMTYRLPGGSGARLVALALGLHPEQDLADDLSNLKSFMEARPAGRPIARSG